MKLPLLIILAGVMPFCASADPIYGLPGPAVTTNFVKNGTGNAADACSNVAGSSSNAGLAITYNDAACVGYSGFWNLDQNGVWENTPSIGDASGFSSLTIDLGGYYSYAGGFMNFAEFFDWSIGSFPGGAEPTVAALDANHRVLQSYDIFGAYSGDTGDVNAGFIFGISSNSMNISYLQVTDLVMSSVSLVAPEPSTPILAGLALAGITLLARRNRYSI